MLLHLLCLASASLTLARQSEFSQEIKTLTGSERLITTDSAVPTVSLPEDESSIFVSGTASIPDLSTTSNATASITSTSTKESLTQIVGGTRTTGASGNMTTSSTTTSATPTNTQPCNNYPEFCSRRYSNITEVCAHNSPFVRKNNAASNQAIGVTQQLNDGIRMLQGQTHMVNGTLHYCHTSCDLLDAGTVEDYLREVTDWLDHHPFDVITILFGNGDYAQTDANGKPLVTAVDFVAPIEKSGLKRYIYQPPKTHMKLDDWPTLSELIFLNKRVVTLIDYNFDHEAVPWLLWEFYNMWETPFSPTGNSFPCDLGRPEGLSREDQEELLYMANHNLNVEISIADMHLLVPNYVQLNQTNGVNGTGSLGEMVQTCTARYARPPNFLLVDFYNEGPFNGSVFAVAAEANNVTYDRKCCGTASDAAQVSATHLSLVIAIAVCLVLF
ncbi:PLC-like phosphodiesterase [Westerdykella ornata]|uniref:PLC-like phosphodiesterase n=1 Tax=Westerdykella ornata TaxID=318751 RepID=A0A6A6JEY7_WESOR|nr:PLC-like phosphodiesterase [Westerdykella ornata]KAF2275121.1 PLC-like phosphodiesterase [Westerdykella ornata]